MLMWLASSERVFVKRKKLLMSFFYFFWLFYVRSDFEYIQPPFIDISKKKPMHLMVFVTGRIPKLSQEESHYLFLPRSTVKNFITELWAANCV